MFCLLLLSAKYVLAQIKSACAWALIEVGYFFPGCRNLGQAWLEWQTQSCCIVSALSDPADLLLALPWLFSAPAEKQCSSLSYGHSYCGQKLSLAHSSSKWGVRFISSESTHGVVLMKEQGEIKHEVEMSLRNLLWSVGSQNTMWIKLDDSQQGQTHKTASFLKESWHFFSKMATWRPLRDISHILPFFLF